VPAQKTRFEYRHRLPQGAEITMPPSVCAAAWAERRYPSANGAVSGLKSIATRETSGAASFSSASQAPNQRNVDSFQHADALVAACYQRSTNKEPASAGLAKAGSVFTPEE
jgi:hypothetical protein